MTEKKDNGVEWPPLILIILISVGLWQLTPPSGLNTSARHSVIIFAAAVASIVAKILPIDTVDIIGIMVFTLTYTAGDKTANSTVTTALSELGDSPIQLIVMAFVITRGFIKAGLGRRIALQVIRLLDRCTLGLTYGLAFAGLILLPIMPSSTARCDGVIYPVADSLACNFHSSSGDEPYNKTGTFLTTCIGDVNDVTAVLFMTGYTGNLLAVKLMANAGVTPAWDGRLMVALLSYLVSLLLVPLLIYWIMCPEIKHTPDAPSPTHKELAEMGSMSRGE